MSERISIVCLGLMLALSVGAEEIPKPQHIPRKYTDRIDFHSVTFNQKTPDEIAKEGKASKSDLKGNVSAPSSSAPTPSVFLNARPRPLRIMNNAPPLLGDDKSKDTKKSGWGWLADDVLNAKAEKKSESENTAETDNGFGYENDLFTFSSVNENSLWEKKDTSSVRDDNIERSNNGQRDFSSDKNTKPIIQKSALANISENMDQNSWQRSGDPSDPTKKSEAKESKNPYDDKPRELDIPLSHAALSSSSMDSSLDKLASGLKPAEMRSDRSLDSLQPSRDSSYSSFTPTPIGSSAISFDHNDSRSSDLFSTPRNSYGSDSGLGTPKSATLPDLYQSPSFVSSFSGDSLKSSSFSAEPTPAPTSWSSVDDSKNNQGIRTQTLPW